MGSNNLWPDTNFHAILRWPSILSPGRFSRKVPRPSKSQMELVCKLKWYFFVGKKNHTTSLYFISCYSEEPAWRSLGGREKNLEFKYSLESVKSRTFFSTKEDGYGKAVLLL